MKLYQIWMQSSNPGGVIAILVFDLMTLNIALRVALGCRIIFTKFDLRQLFRAWIIAFLMLIRYGTLLPLTRRGFTLGQWGQLPPNLNLAPKSLLTATLCSSKTSKQGAFFWRVGVVDLVVLACVLRPTTKKGRQLFVLPPFPQNFLLEPPLPLTFKVRAFCQLPTVYCAVQMALESYREYWTEIWYDLHHA